MRKKGIITILSIALSLSLMGCESKEFVKEDTNINKMQEIEKESGKTNKPNLKQIISVPGEKFKLSCSYDTGRYNLSNWRITDSKALNMKVHTIHAPKNKEVLIEHVHADIYVKSTLATIDGLIQDSMDDVFHGTSQDGFYINNHTNYTNIFAIEGYSKTFFEGWGYAVGQYGDLSISEERLTEKHLVVDGYAYAQKVQIVYDLAIKDKNSTKYRSVSVISEFLIPLNTKQYAKDIKERDEMSEVLK